VRKIGFLMKKVLSVPQALVPGWKEMESAVDVGLSFLYVVRVVQLPYN
jgi:hypothetical protein